MRSNLFRFKNCVQTSSPEVYETPRSFSSQPSISGSGSDHIKSQSNPVSGTSHGRLSCSICSTVCRFGERPPCTQKILRSRTAQTGSQLKHSVKDFQIFTEYRRLHSS